MDRTQACFITPGMKLYYPAVVCMLRCGSYSSKDKTLSLKMLNLRTQHSDPSDLFPSKG